MLTDVGQAGTNAGICKMLIGLPSAHFLPNPMLAAYLLGGRAKQVKMERNFKFRAYNQVEKKMYYEDKMGDVFKWQNECQIQTIMQFTGLLDKNKKEIFEGDILSFITQRKNGFQEDGKKVILKPVQFGEFCYGNNVLGDFIGFHIDGSSIQYKLSHNCEVIGNIFQNPDLLDRS
jgi:hypothetical protein